MFSALIVGCGNIAGALHPKNNTTHGGVFFSHSSINIVACVDPVLNKAIHYSKIYSCSPFTTLGEALGSYTPDIISVCTPDHTHYEIARQILLSAKPPRVLFIEKPLCANRQQYDDLILLSRYSSTLVVVNHSRRFDDNISLIRKAYQNNFFGSLFSVRCCYYSGWLHNGSHVVDTLAYLFDDTLVIDSILNSSPSPYPSDPTLDVQGHFRNLLCPIIIHSIPENYYQVFEFDFFFDDSRLRIEDFGSRVVLERRTTNSSNENILVLEDFQLPYNPPTCMQNAADRIVLYLSSSDSTPLLGARLQDLGPTLNSLWSALSFYETSQPN